MLARGADFSSHQDDAALTWALQQTTLHFAFVKATEGEGYVSPRARTQIARLEANRVLVGLYHFLDHDVDGARQWDHFEQAAGHWVTPAVVACDQESDRGVLVPDQVARAFIRRGQQRGYRVGRYGDARVMGRRLGEDWRWYARWAQTPPAGRWDVWQFSDGGGRQDWNEYNGTPAQLAAWWARQGRREGAPPARWWIHDELHKVALGPYRLPVLTGRLLAYAARHPRVSGYQLARK